MGRPPAMAAAARNRDRTLIRMREQRAVANDIQIPADACRNFATICSGVYRFIFRTSFTQ